MKETQFNEDSSPLVSIIITSFNRAGFIRNTIDSALSQDYPNLEVIVSDNCSTDDSDKIIKSYLHDNRLKYFRNDANVGMIGNFESATSKASGDYITYVSSDDYLINDHFITEAISLVKKYKNVLLVLGRHNKLHMASGKIETKGGFSEEFYKGTDLFLKFAQFETFSWAAALMHKKSLLTIRPFEKKIPSIDVMTNLSLLLMGNMAFLNKPSYLQRIHDENATNKIDVGQSIENFGYMTSPYSAALAAGKIPKEKLDKWLLDAVFLYVRARAVLFSAQNRGDYERFMDYVKKHFPGVLKKLRFNFKWNVLTFLFKRPNFSLPLFKIISKGHFIYLERIINNGKKSYEKVKF